MLHFLLSTLATLHPSCRAPGGGLDEDAMSLTLRPLNQTGAVCNDGSPGVLYYRPCCDGPDPGDWCNASETSRWLIVFGDGNSDGWCWDAASCAKRAKETPALTSSVGLAHYFKRAGEAHGSTVGAFDKSGEVNPNFYPAYAAYVPYCSSDLFTGSSAASDSTSAPVFRGREIALAAISAVSKEMDALGGDYEVVIVGGAGIIATLPELRAALPATAAVSAVCDGCILLDDADGANDIASDGESDGMRNSSAARAHAAPCVLADAHSCPPSRTLPAAVRLWQPSLPETCGGWRCLLDVVNVAKVRRSHSEAPLRLLAQQPLYDKQTASAHPAMGAESLRARLLDALAPADIVVASACTRPPAALTRAAFFAVTFSGHTIPPPSFATALYGLVENVSSSHPFVDTCTGANCNPSCDATAAGAGRVGSAAK